MLPLVWLVGDPLIAIKLFTVGLSTLGAFVLFFIARKGAGSVRGGLVGAALYLTVPLAVLPFSWGITSNVFGEFFALCALAVLVVGYPQLSPARPAFWCLLFCLLMALLSHPGVVQLTGLAFGFISLLWILSGRIMAGRRAGAWALGCLLLASGVAYGVYYSNFAEQMLTTLREIQAERAAQSVPGGLRLRIGGSVADRSLGLNVRFVESRSEWLFGGLRGFWQEAHAYYRVWPLVGAALGFVLLWPRRLGLTSPARSRKSLVALAAGGWLLAVLVFALVGWTVNLYVRYALFALPVVALGSGILLSRMWMRGRAGALLTLMILFFFAVEALALWQYRITYAFK
jgi:hypothetical protein